MPQSCLDDACCICLAPLLSSGTHRLPCPVGHYVHEQCMVDLQRFDGGSMRCPLCRENLENLHGVDYYVLKGMRATLQKEYDQAQQFFSQACDLRPDDPSLQHQLGLLYQGGDTFTHRMKAQMHFEEAVKLGHWSSLIGLSKTYFRQGDVDTALRLCTQAHYLGVGEASASLMVHYHALGDLDLAQRYALDASEKGCANGSLLYAQICEDRGDIQVQKRYLWTALSQGSTLAAASLALLYLEASTTITEMAPALRDQLLAFKLIARVMKSDGDEAKHIVMTMINGSFPDRFPDLIPKDNLSVALLEPGQMVLARDEIAMVAGPRTDDGTHKVLIYGQGECRVGVEEMRPIKPSGHEQADLSPLGQSLTDVPWEGPFGEDLQRLQTGIQVNFDQHSNASGNPALINAQVSRQLLRSSAPATKLFKAVLLKINRPDIKLKEILAGSDDPEIAGCREALIASGQPWELSCKAKMLVPPLHAKPVLEEIERRKLKLFPESLILQPVLEPRVMKLLRPEFYPKRGYREELRVRSPQSRLPSSMNDIHEKPPVQHGFIEYWVPMGSSWTPDEASQARSS